MERVDCAKIICFNLIMRNLLILLILLVSAFGAMAQRATPSPTPVEPKLERLAKITSVTRTLKGVSASDPKFEGKEDHFRIRLPLDSVTYTPAKWPKAVGESPTPGRAWWHMVEADLGVSISPLPPGQASKWTSERLSAEETDSIEAGVQNAGGTKIYEKKITLGDLRGKEAKIVAGDTTILMRIFFANDRQYVLGASWTKGDDTEALVKAAFDTFEIIRKGVKK
jgi:hypothetical protein